MSIFHNKRTLEGASVPANLKEKNRKKDAILLIVVSFLGLSGLVLVLKSSISSESDSNFHQNTTPATKATDSKKINQRPNVDEIAAADKIEDVKVAALKSHFLISGEREAKQNMIFTVENFENGVSYNLELGNGVTKKLTSPQTSFSYSKAGKYRIVLKATYKEQTKILFSDYLAVAEAVEIVTGHRESQ